MKRIVIAAIVLLAVFVLTMPMVSTEGIQFNFPDGTGYWLEF